VYEAAESSSVPKRFVLDKFRIIIERSKAILKPNLRRLENEMAFPIMWSYN
jgi:hypothetical protein